VAISNQRLIAFDERGVTFRWKDYRAKGRTRYKTMTLSAEEFMRRFLLHVLPSGFHRIRHYGLLANPQRSDNLDKVRALLNVVPDADAAHPASAAPTDSGQPTFLCPDCGAAMIVVDIIARGQPIRAPPQLPCAA
jgi:Putative transposase